jgi:hypothetical protein
LKINARGTSQIEQEMRKNFGFEVLCVLEGLERIVMISDLVLEDGEFSYDYEVI